MISWFNGTLQWQRDCSNPAKAWGFFFRLNHNLLKLCMSLLRRSFNPFLISFLKCKYMVLHIDCHLISTGPANSVPLIFFSSDIKYLCYTVLKRRLRISLKFDINKGAYRDVSAPYQKSPVTSCCCLTS